tara:strand:+ start:9554 stop:12799 length:3246 start_codon:yes stop_codon:yes gene_type:complete
MAYTNTYNFEFMSNAGLAYRLEFWDQGTGATSYNAIEGRLGPNAAALNYSSSGKEMFAPIKAGTLDIEFMVTDTVDASYVNKLRHNRKERDVYVYLYLTGSSHMSGSVPAQIRPLFAGYLLMDLADDKDVSLPFIQKLKAVDGLAALKYYDFVPPSTSQSSDHLYEKHETFIPDASNSGGVYPEYRTILNWLQYVLYYTGYATTAKGSGSESRIYTACNWFNANMANLNGDPLNWSRGRAYGFYEAQGETGAILYKPMTCYEVLAGICKSFGLRCVMYRNTFYFISLSNYTTNNTGTLANPVNINYFSYEMDVTNTTSTGNGTKLDYYWGRYYVPVTNAPGSMSVNRKLATTVFGLLPPLKKVKVRYFNISDYNYFTAFPLFPLNGALGSCPSQGYEDYGPLGIFEFDGVNDRTFYQEVWLDWINNSGNSVVVGTAFTLQARLVGSSGAWLQYGLNGGINIQWFTMGSASYYVGTEFYNAFTLPEGASSIDIVEGINFMPFLRYVTFPTSAFPAGQYEVRYKIAATWFCPDMTYIDGHGAVINPLNPNPTQYQGMTPADNDVTYGNTSITAGMGTSIFAEIQSGAIGSNSIETQIAQSGDDTATLEVKPILFGDGGAGGLEVYDGANWVNSGFVGYWGIDTLSGTASLAETLAREILKRQLKNVRKASMKINMNVDYTDTDGSGSRPMFPMPISRFFTPSHSTSGTTSGLWIMNTGRFNFVSDVWDLKLYEFETFALTGLTTTTTDTYGGNSGNTGHPGESPTPGGSMAKVGSFNNPTEYIEKHQQRMTSRPIALISADSLIDDTTTTSQTITSLSVRNMPTALLKDGDTIELRSASLGPVSEDNNFGTLDYGKITFTVAADQLADATSISVDSKTIYKNIYKLDEIHISTTDLLMQYQHKTKGTIGGMDVTADSIDGALEVGRNQIFFRVEGQNLSEGNYYVLNGEDNNKSGRFSPTNTNAPSSIGTQKGFKAMKLVADQNFTLESGTFIGSGSIGWDINLILYKTTPVDGSSSTTAMTKLGEYTIELGGDSITQVDVLSIDSSSINRGDIIVPHLYAESPGEDPTFDFRGGLVFTLIRR